MTDESPRARRLADRIKVIVAEVVERRIKDPRLGFVTITDVRVTNDLREATVYFTVLGDERERAESAVALESAKGMLRTEVGRATSLRYAPTLAFVADAMPDSARHIEELIVASKEADRQVHDRASEATYAGDPDPYRVTGEASTND